LSQKFANPYHLSWCHSTIVLPHDGDCRFINEFIETLAIAANEKSRKAAEEAEAARQRIPDRVLQRKPSISGLEMIALGTPESRLSTSGKSSVQKSDGKFDIGASIKPELLVDTTIVKEVS
jgi:hypothetical protein